MSIKNVIKLHLFYTRFIIIVRFTLNKSVAKESFDGILPNEFKMVGILNVFNIVINLYLKTVIAFSSTSKPLWYM